MIKLQLTLADYLDIQNTSADDRSNSTFSEQTNNINSYFNRRKMPTLVFHIAFFLFKKKIQFI